MKADVAGPEGGAVFHSTSTTQPLETRKNGYVNGLQRFTDLDYHINVNDKDDFNLDTSDCGVIQGSNEVKTIYNLDQSNEKISVDMEDLKPGPQQPDVILTNGYATGKRSEGNGGFYLLSNGRTKKNDALVIGGLTHHVDLLNGDALIQGVSATMNGDGGESPTTSWDRTAAEMKEHAFNRLQDELKKAHRELQLRDEEVGRLSRIREEVEAELEDLTASLFQVNVGL